MPQVAFSRDAAMSGQSTEHARLAGPEPLSTEWLLALASRLQTSLSVERLLEVFAEAAAAAVPFDSLSLVSHGHGLHLSLGTPAEHSVTYTLVIAEQTLGDLCFTRGQPFEVGETERLEILGSYLLYPLRNAVLYRAAVSAALRDQLTGVYNRSGLEADLRREVSLARRHATPLSVIMLDLDHFKAINDRHGHIVGDCVLKAVVGVIQRTVRESDAVYRFGGEEFSILAARTDAAGAQRLAVRILAAVAEAPMRCGSRSIALTLSAGVAELGAADSGQRLLARADRALYQSKSAGRNRATCLD